MWKWRRWVSDGPTHDLCTGLTWTPVAPNMEAVSIWWLEAVIDGAAASWQWHICVSVSLRFWFRRKPGWSQFTENHPVIAQQFTGDQSGSSGLKPALATWLTFLFSPALLIVHFTPLSVALMRISVRADGLKVSQWHAPVNSYLLHKQTKEWVAEECMRAAVQSCSQSQPPLVSLQILMISAVSFNTNHPLQTVITRWIRSEQWPEPCDRTMWQLDTPQPLMAETAADFRSLNHKRGVQLRAAFQVKTSEKTWLFPICLQKTWSWCCSLQPSPSLELPASGPDPQSSISLWVPEWFTFYRSFLPIWITQYLHVIRSCPSVELPLTCFCLNIIKIISCSSES